VEAVAAAGDGSDSEEEDDPEELVFYNGSSDDDAPPEVGNLTQAPAVEEDLELAALDAEDLEEPVRPDYCDVYMPYVNLRHYDNLSYAFVNPPQPDSDELILQAADLGCGPHHVSLYPSSRGARVAVFSSSYHREEAVNNGPFLGREVSIHFERHDEADNRFLFEHETIAALSITDFPLEHWYRHLITHSSAPYANPHAIDPVCLTGLDFSAVLVLVKAETITDIPLNLTVKNHYSTGSTANVSVIGLDDLAPGSNNPHGPDFDPLPEAFSSDGEQEFIELHGGEGYVEVLQALGVPPPLAPQGEPSSASPAAPAVARALAHAPAFPQVAGGPILFKIKTVLIKLHLGFFLIFVEGSNGERAVYRLPLRRASDELGCKGLMVANFTTASVGLIDSIARVGPKRLPTLAVDVVARGSAPSEAFQIPLQLASGLILGQPPESAVVVDSDGVVDAASPSTASLPAVSALRLDARPVLDTVWRVPSPPPEPRSSSRLIASNPKHFISIVDKAILRKKDLNEGPSDTQHRRGKLSADDLFEVAAEDELPLPLEMCRCLLRLAILRSPPLTSRPLCRPSELHEFCCCLLLGRHGLQLLGPWLV
jgi:hypothetical protein